MGYKFGINWISTVVNCWIGLNLGYASHFQIHDLHINHILLLVSCKLMIAQYLIIIALYVLKTFFEKQCFIIGLFNLLFFLCSLIRYVWKFIVNIKCHVNYPKLNMKVGRLHETIVLKFLFIASLSPSLLLASPILVSPFSEWPIVSRSPPSSNSF